MLRDVAKVFSYAHYYVFESSQKTLFCTFTVHV